MKNWLKGIATLIMLSVLFGCGGGTSSEVIAPPPTPTSLSVEPGDEVTTVQWPAIADVTSYNLYWSDTTPVTLATSTLIANVVSPYLHTGLVNGKPVYYAVSAVTANGESTMSDSIGATPVAPVPASPKTVNATSGDKAVTLNWSPVARATSYKIYWSNTSNVVPGGAGVSAIDNIQSTSYSHVGLTNGSSYYYVVVAVSTGGESVVSSTASALPLPPVPGAPTNLSATSGDTQVHLSWSPSTDATSYNVYWSKAAGIVPGAVGVTQISGITTTSYLHTGLTNGDTYYYVVSSVGMGGESAMSKEVSARPLPPPPPAPLGVTAIAPKDVIEVRVQWFDVTDYPSAASPIQVGYNVYRGMQPGLATYYQDSSRATKVANVTAPFTDSSVVSGTTYYYVVTSFVPGLSGTESVPSGEVSAATGRAGGTGSAGGGGKETGFGNNLAFPVVFADAYGITGVAITGAWAGVGPFTPAPAFDFNVGIRPLSTEVLATFPSFDSKTAVSIGGITYYPQATASTWQAQWSSNSAGAPLEVIVDWGDALLSKTYTASSLVRIETVLQQDATIAGVTDTMTAYKMALLSGSGITELQGTDGSTYASATRNVYVINARLKIEKIATGGGADTVIFDKAVYEGFGATTEEGGGGSGGSGGGGSSPPASLYSAELNVGGSLVYGYNLRLSSITGIADKTGQYRITFSLDPVATVGTVKVPNHIKMVTKRDDGATLDSNGLSSSVVITVN